jgi:hypothetical protein
MPSRIVLVLAGLFAASPSLATESGSAANAALGHLGSRPFGETAFAKKVEHELAERGALVAIVARLGRPLSDMPEGMRYTHVGFAVYSTIEIADGRKLPGYVMYNEYQEGSHPDISDLVQDYPADFFADVARLEAGIVVPSLALQRRLLDTITSPIYARLHDPHYSVIANPYTVGRQNCTKFVLDVITAAIYQTGDLAVIKANERAFFVAQPVNIVPLKLFFGALFNPELSLSDQPGKPVTATFERIAGFLMTYDRGAERFTVVP